MLIIFILTLPVVPKRGRGAVRTEIPGVGAVGMGVCVGGGGSRRREERGSRECVRKAIHVTTTMILRYNG